MPIQSKLRPYLEAWHRHSVRPSDGVVFFGKHGRDRRYPLSPDHVSKTFKSYARDANMPETVNLHGLRHSCATYLLRKGFDISDVAAWLGHSHLEMTRIYEHLDETDRSEAHPGKATRRRSSLGHDPRLFARERHRSFFVGHHPVRTPP